MKAIVITDFGGPDVFRSRDLPRPEPLSDEVLVRIYAPSMSPVDYKLHRDGQVAGIVSPAILGPDVSGVVEAVGSVVENL